MNLYQIIISLIVLILFVHVFEAKEAMTEFINRLFDIPKFSDYGSNEPIFKIVVRAIYLITLVGIIKLFVNRGKK